MSNANLKLLVVEQSLASLFRSKFERSISNRNLTCSENDYRISSCGFPLWIVSTVKIQFTVLSRNWNILAAIWIGYNFQIQNYMRKYAVCKYLYYCLILREIYDVELESMVSMIIMIWRQIASCGYVIFPKLILLFFTQVAFGFTVIVVLHLILLPYQTFDVFHCTIFRGWILNTFHDESEIKNKIVLSLDGNCKLQCAIFLLHQFSWE